RASASPAASDLLGALPFKGNSSTGVERTYAKILAQIIDATNAGEDGALLLQSIVAGTLATRATLGQGLQIGAPTGGDKGAGTINVAPGLYINNVARPFTKSFTSPEQTITSAGALTIAHGLGVQPTLVAAKLVCTSADNGYAEDDEIVI